MTVKELIVKVRKENKIVQHKQEELARLEALCGVSGISYDAKEGTSGSRNVNKNEQSYLRYIEFKDDLKEYIAAALSSRKKLMALIDKLESHQAIDIMYKYCMENQTLRQIGEEKSYTKQAIHKIYTRSIEEMDKELTKVDPN